MRHLRKSRSNSMVEAHRRVPLNTVILPPLSPNFSDSGAQIIQKILVNKSRSGSVGGELVALGRPEVNGYSSEGTRSPDAARVAQLEQNIRFLQEQHQMMLSGLHQEIDNLRHRNRELQFQIIFLTGTTPSSPSSPEDDTKHKVYISPKQVNVIPLHVEILEKELGELKLQLQDIESQNSHLSILVEEQKQKLDCYERDRERELEQASKPNPELLRQLDDAEALIRKLKRENLDLRRENSAGSSYGSGGSYKRDDGNYQGPRNSSGQNRGNGRHRGNGGGHYRGNWFPPLHSQSYWQSGRSIERNGESSGENTALPSLQMNTSGNHGQYQGRRGTNNNHYHNGDGRKYRAGQNRGSKAS